MRLPSTAASLAGHLALVAAVVGAPEARPAPQPANVVVLPPLAPADRATASPALPEAPDVVIDPARLPPLPELPTPVLSLPAGPGPSQLVPVSPGKILAGADRGHRGAGGPVDLASVDELPVLLVGPAPEYPELLRQAGAEGRVVLEAVVDAAGRVERASIVIVSASHPGFVDAAVRALAAARFRPARVRGRTVSVLIRVPIDFRLRRDRFPD